MNWIGASATLLPSQEGYGTSLIPEFRKPVDPADAFPPPVLQAPEIHTKFRRTELCAV